MIRDADMAAIHRSLDRIAMALEAMVAGAQESEEAPAAPEPNPRLRGKAIGVGTPVATPDGLRGTVEAIFLPNEAKVSYARGLGQPYGTYKLDELEVIE